MIFSNLVRKHAAISNFFPGVNCVEQLRKRDTALINWSLRGLPGVSGGTQIAESEVPCALISVDH